MEELINDVADKLLANHKIGKITTTSIMVDGIRFAKNKFNDTYLDGPSLKEMGALDLLAVSDTDKKKAFAEIIHSIEVKKYDDARSSLKDNDIPECKIDRSNYLPIVDVESDETLLVNIVTKKLSSFNVQTWERRLTPEERALYYEQMRDAVLVYDPYELSTFVLTKFESEDVLKVNTYIPPQWRLEDCPADLECPEEIMKLLVHLFPDEKCRKYVIHWLYNCLVNRNETYLVLNGAKGVGKGVFCSIVTMLVGFDNFTEAPVAMLKEKFNAVLDKKRVIIFDEYKVQKNEHTRLKRYINRFQNIEKKSIDANKAVEIYNSYIISNNDESDMYVESDDRRFSVADITDKPLTDIFTVDEIKALDDKLQDDPEMALQFGHWIYEYGENVELNNFTVYTGRKFNRLVYQSLSEWKKLIVDTVTSMKSNEYTIKAITRDFNKKTGKQGKFPFSNKKITDFLLNFRTEYGHKVGVLKGKGADCMIVPSKNYMPRVTEIKGTGKAKEDEDLL